MVSRWVAADEGMQVVNVEIGNITYYELNINDLKWSYQGQWSYYGEFTLLVVKTVFQALLNKVYGRLEPSGIERTLRTTYFPDSDQNNSMAGDLRKELRVRFGRNNAWTKRFIFK